MRGLTFNLLVLVCTVFLVQSVSADRRRRRCYVRLCFKCGYYVNSRGRRSIRSVEGESPGRRGVLPIEDELRAQDGMGAERAFWPRAEVPFLPVYKSEVLDGVNPVVAEGNVATSARSKNHGRRSVASHFERCLHLLRSRCCKFFTNTATYIGYRVKKN